MEILSIITSLIGLVCLLLITSHLSSIKSLLTKQNHILKLSNKNLIEDMDIATLPLDELYHYFNTGLISKAEYQAERNRRKK